MMPETNRHHPWHLLAAWGIRDELIILATAIVALFQYIFLLKLWEGYVLAWSGDLIHENVVIAGVALSILGVLAIFLYSLRRWTLASAACHQLDRPATNHSFEAIREALDEQLVRSSLAYVPKLLYTAKNTNALEVRFDRLETRSAIVVGLSQRQRQRLQPEVFAAQLGHEISHLELGRTGSEILIRRILAVHYINLAWLVLVFAGTIAFIDMKGIDTNPRFWGFNPAFHLTIYAGLWAQLAILLLSSVIILLYSHYFVVRREHLHDLRGSQLAGSDVLARRVFEPLSKSRSKWKVIKDFFSLHPGPAERARTIQNRDVIMLSPIVFPLIVIGAHPVLLLLSVGWRDYFHVDAHWWNLGLTIGSGLLLYMILWADANRLGLIILVRKWAWKNIILYAICAGLATQISRVFLAVSRGLRHDLPIEDILESLFMGIVSGGGRTAVMVGTILLLLAYLSGARIAARGERYGGTYWFVDNAVFASLVISAYSIKSLTVLVLIGDVVTFIVGVIMLYLIWLVLSSRCFVCAARPWNSLYMDTKCKCGVERLPEIRRFLNSGYRVQTTRAS